MATTHAQLLPGEVWLDNPRRAPMPAHLAPDRTALAFHQSLPGYQPTRLAPAPTAAAALGAAQVWVKDESSRLGLPAFKILGASWATARAVAAELTRRGLPAPALDAGLAPLADAARALQPMRLCCATDGNHGRAVARMARLLGFSATIFIPAEMTEARAEAIASEGAEVIRLDGSYDDAVARSADEAGAGTIVVSDTSWPGYTDIPGWVIDGYGTILFEIEDQLAAQGESWPEVTAVQMGVGAFAAAVARHMRRPGAPAGRVLVGTEPVAANCILLSLEADRLVMTPGPHESIMAGLNCGLPSEIAWPAVSAGLDTVVTANDDRAREAMRLLAADGIVAGETGAAGLGGLLAWRDAFGGDFTGKRVLIMNTEGATDPASYRAITGRDAASVAG
jgi:diaminopropionate ammonia-lyase